MQDRTTQAFIAGIVVTFIPMVFMIYTIYGLGIISLRFMDYAAIISWGAITDKLLPSITVETGIWLAGGFLSVAFIQSLKNTYSQDIIFKSVLYVFLYWLLINSCVTAFKLDGLSPLGFKTSLLEALGGIIDGMVAAKIYAYLANKYGQ